MTEPEAPKPDEKPAEEPRKDTVGWPDVAAIGIGCVVVIIFFVALVLVGIMRSQE